MSRWACCSSFLGMALLAAGCTEPNPRSCKDGTCTDPSLPFCDIDGALAGQPETCIAVSCTPGEFTACRGDQAITCNTAGTDYDLLQCERGCDATSDGCRVCDPGETVCANGKVQTCDTSGAVIASETCPLGCFEDQPRCREIDPSNGLATYLDAAASAPDLDLPDGTYIDTTTGRVWVPPSTDIPVMTALVPAPAGGVPIRVLMANSVKIGNVQVTTSWDSSPGPALAIVARDAISVEGTLSLWPDDYQGSSQSPGGISIPGCDGGRSVHETSSSGHDAWSGVGGAGHATAGGRGGGIGDLGDGTYYISGGTAGTPSGSETLEPLRGGCGGPNGGGAVQLTSRKAITMQTGSMINANGQLGIAYLQGPDALLGGGAGGGILVEAPTVTLEQSATLVVNGGPAATQETLNPPISVTRAPSTGGSCTSTANYYCGNGGNGAAADGPATSGQGVPYSTSVTVQASGGGGGLGYIRINTATGTYSKASDVVESGIISTSPLRTR